MVESIQRNSPAILIIRIAKDAGMNVLNLEDLQSVRKGVVKVPHSV